MAETLEETSYSGLYKADGLSDLFNRDHFSPANVIELPRQISGDFSSLARKLGMALNLQPDTSLEIGLGRFQSLMRQLNKTGLSEEEMQAALQIGKDLRDLGQRVPNINLRINSGDAYAKHDSGAAFRFHVDGSSRLLCNYNEPVAEWLHIGDEEPDAEMMEMFGYAEYFDKKAGAEIHKLQTGHIYHFLGLMNTEDAPPFVHRGLKSGPDDPPRLLLVGEYDEPVM